MSSESDLLRLIGLLYESAQDSAVWPAFLEGYAKLLGASVAALQIHRFEQHRSEIVADFGIASPIRTSYHEHYSALNLFREQGQRQFQTGAALCDEDICPRSTLERSTFYNEFLLPLGGVFKGVGVIERRPADAVVITALRGRRQRQWSDVDLTLMRLLLAHVARARAMEEQARLLVTGIAAFDGLNLGVAFVRWSGQMIYANDTARGILQEDDGLDVHGGALRAAHPVSEANLQQALVATESSRSTVVAIVRRSLQRPYQLLIGPGSGTSLLAGIQAAHAMVVIVDPEQPPSIGVDALSSLYGLTRREGALASVLSRGVTLQEAARDLGIGYETARSHLRRVFEKTGTTRQAELIVLFSRLPAK